MHNPLLPTAYDVWWSIAVGAVIVLAVVALVSLSRAARRLPAGQALVWTVLCLAVPVLGPAAWLTVGRRAAASGHALDR